MAGLPFMLLMLVVMVVPAAHAACTVDSATMTHLNGLPPIDATIFQGEWYVVRRNTLDTDGKIADSIKVKLEAKDTDAFKLDNFIQYNQTNRASSTLEYQKVDSHYEQNQYTAFFFDHTSNSIALLDIEKNDQGNFLYNTTIIAILKRTKTQPTDLSNYSELNNICSNLDDLKQVPNTLN